MQTPNDAASYKSLIAIQPDGSKPLFFCIHSNDLRLDSSRGDVLQYAVLAQYLGGDQPFYVLQSVGIAGDDEPLSSVEAIASLYISELKTVQPVGPYNIGGYQTGAIVALEVAHQLRRTNNEVALLAFIDVSPELFAARQNGSLGHHRNVAGMFKHVLWDAVHNWTRRSARHLPRMLWDVHLASEYALREYNPHPFPGLVSLFLSERISSDPSDWNNIASVAVSIHTVNAKINEMLVEPGVQLLSRHITASLNVPTTR